MNIVPWRRTMKRKAAQVADSLHEQWWWEVNNSECLRNMVSLCSHGNLENETRRSQETSLRVQVWPVEKPIFILLATSDPACLKEMGMRRYTHWYLTKCHLEAWDKRYAVSSLGMLILLLRDKTSGNKTGGTGAKVGWITHNKAQGQRHTLWGLDFGFT